MKSEAAIEAMDSMNAKTRPARMVLQRWLRTFWQRMLLVAGRRPKSLRLCESLPLGERRFVAVVEFEDLRFLLGGTSSSLVLLARLGDKGSPSSTSKQFFLSKEEEEG